MLETIKCWTVSRETIPREKSNSIGEKNKAGLRQVFRIEDGLYFTPARCSISMIVSQYPYIHCLGVPSLPHYCYLPSVYGKLDPIKETILARIRHQIHLPILFILIKNQYLVLVLDQRNPMQPTAYR
ncbi:hypothetical protein V6N11_062407 [Hibiscus sabdariffa]|uniref:Uncharacterized protein n=1 Tax=Hibiscus sabdariffa TaxID=183260 RepID=A0ABR2PSH2_9ROSI